MTQAGNGSAVKKWLWIALAVVVGLAVAVLQGLGVFVFEGFAGSFLTVIGLKCVAIPAAVELVLAIVILKNFDELHSIKASNPHSLIGQALRKDAGRPPAPPPTREAWKGGFEDMDDASDKMSKGR